MFSSNHPNYNKPKRTNAHSSLAKTEKYHKESNVKRKQSETQWSIISFQMNNRSRQRYDTSEMSCISAVIVL